MVTRETMVVGVGSKSAERNKKEKVSYEVFFLSQPSEIFLRLPPALQY